MQVLGRYELVRPLAKGGMAEVYLARRRVAGVEKRLVIKRMKREHSRDPRFLDLFVREAQLSMSLVQQNIVPVFDFGRIGDDVFLAMEYIDGKDLGSTLAIDRSAGLPPVLAAYVAAECCKALDHAHGRREASTPEGVIHRDVTPRNVLLSWAGDVMLADFGIAAVVGQAAGDSMGTPGYMAPEQARGETIDARADVYALGIVLWETVTGKHVRPTASRSEALAVARTGELPEVGADVPAGLAAIIRAATAADATARYDSARTMADALDAFIVGERARDGGPPPQRRLGEWLRERWSGDADAESVAGGASGAAGADLAHVVTFLDDGAEEVRGTRTQRSVAETVDADAAAAVKVTKQADGDGAPAVAKRKTVDRRWWVAIAAVMLMGGAVAAYALRGPGAKDGGGAVAGAGTAAATGNAAGTETETATGDREPPPSTATETGSATRDREPPPSTVTATETGTAAATETGTAAATGTATETATGTGTATGSGSAGKRRPPKSGSGSGAGSATTKTAPVSTTKRPITLGAIPWANVTIDKDPQVHETPVTLELTVGAHRVTYANPQLGVTRTVTVNVPAEGPARHVENLRP